MARINNKNKTTALSQKFHFLYSIMTRDDIQNKILTILTEDFEFEKPGLDDNLRDDHGFDSIDAIELLGKIELTILGFSLTREEKEKAMEIRTINDIVGYIEDIKLSRTNLQ
jgi:acyl carrier protein